MEFELCGFPEDGPTLRLDHEQFAYAGKFVMSSTGKAVAREQGAVLGAVAFNTDHTDRSVARIRYVTVRKDRRGQGIGSRLLRWSASELLDSEYRDVDIGVNNPVAYRACYRAGFVWTGEETGIAEVLLTYDPDVERSTQGYHGGLEPFQGRDLPDPQRSALETMLRAGPPPVIELPQSENA